MLKAIEDAISRKSDELDIMLEESSEYLECNNEVINIMKEIKETLPKEKQYLISNLSDDMNFRKAIVCDIKFKSGLEEGIKLGIRLSKLIKQCNRKNAQKNAQTVYGNKNNN